MHMYEKCDEILLCGLRVMNIFTNGQTDVAVIDYYVLLSFLSSNFHERPVKYFAI